MNLPCVKPLLLLSSFYPLWLHGYWSLYSVVHQSLFSVTVPWPSHTLVAGLRTVTGTYVDYLQTLAVGRKTLLHINHSSC